MSRPTHTEPNPLDDAQTAWAIYQHRAAYAVHLELEAADETVADLAHALNEDPAWLTRKLHGQTPVDLGDIMAWALHFGIQILPVFDNSKELTTTHQHHSRQRVSEVTKKTPKPRRV